MRVRAFLGVDIPHPAHKPRKSDGLLWLVQPVLGVVNFTIAVTAWAVPIWAITLPIYAVHWPGAAPQVWSGKTLDTWHEVIPVTVAGLVILPLVPWIIRGFAAVDRAAARWGLGQSRQGRTRPVDVAMHAALERPGR